MSATNFFLDKGFTPVRKVAILNAGTTATIWTPETGKRVFLTQLDISTNLGGTIAFYFDNGNNSFGRFTLAGSASVSPSIGCIESTVVSGRLFANASTAASTDGWTINMTGFEL